MKFGFAIYKIKVEKKNNGVLRSIRKIKVLQRFFLILLELPKDSSGKKLYLHRITP